MKRRVAAGVGLLALVWVGFAAVRHLSDLEASSLFGTLDFGVHEFGHLFFGLFGEWIGVAGGSIMQVLIPVALALLFHKQKEPMGVAVCGAWLAIALARMAVYMADARELELDLVSFSPDSDIHDWNYLFTSLGIIAWDTTIADLTRLAGWLALLASAWYGVRKAHAAFRQAATAG
jgi:hypothetical protein